MERLRKGESKFPSGMALTILIANNFVQDPRDDIAFAKTIRKAYSSLYSFLWSEEITSPVQPYNDILSKLTKIQKQNFKAFFKQLVANCDEAIEATDYSHALIMWQKCFGNRFQ